MPRRIIRWFRQHTPAGRYISRVDLGTAIQEDRMRDLLDPDLRERLSVVFGINHASLRISELFMGRD